MSWNEWMNSSFDANFLSTFLYTVITVSLGSLLVATGFFIYTKIKKTRLMPLKRYLLIFSLCLVLMTFSVFTIKWVFFTRLETGNESFRSVNVCYEACVHVDLTETEAETIKTELERLYFGIDNDIHMIQWTQSSERANFQFGDIIIAYAHLDFFEWETWKMAYKVGDDWYVRNDENKISIIFDEILAENATQLQIE